MKENVSGCFFLNTVYTNFDWNNWQMITVKLLKSSESKDKMAPFCLILCMYSTLFSAIVDRDRNESTRTRYTTAMSS